MHLICQNNVPNLTYLCPSLHFAPLSIKKQSFKPGQFDKLSSWALSTASNRPVVAEYEPDGLWLWTQYEGTIRQMTYAQVLITIAWALVVDTYAYQHYSLYLIATAAVNGGDVGSLIDSLSWSSFEIPHSGDPFIETLTALNSLWEYQLSLTIFTLSFFVNHAYSSWRGGKNINVWVAYHFLT